jgi:site-specific DNA recombinase
MKLGADERVSDLYIRVSTDEQAEKGYSQRNQEDVLRKYCAANAVTIRKVVYEDYSAKTFENRPAWSRLLAEYKRKKGLVNQILFVKWDRFSRNAADAYSMIGQLRKLGVEPQAIEQPLDLAIPENKMMLAFYLAAPEVENDRRALNVYYGMRRARVEGRWMGSAPIGYKNKVREDGRKYIAPAAPASVIMKWAFEELATGRYQIEQVRKMTYEKGLKCSRSNFFNMIRNPVYCGKIVVPKSKDEALSIVQGQHEPLVSEALFNDVQDVLTGRRKSHGVKVVSHDMLPLRGFLVCPDCGKILTGSASKGRKQYYYYYHCQAGCKCRFKAEDANSQFIHELQRYTLNTDIAEVVKMVIAEIYESQASSIKDNKKHLITEINHQNGRLSKARDLLLAGDLDPSDYKIIKHECEAKIDECEAKLSAVPQKQESIGILLDRAFQRICSLDALYQNATLEERRQIIGSMYPEKLIFQNNSYRTSRLNEAVRLIYAIGKDFSTNKNRTSGNDSNLSGVVVRPGFEPRQTESESVVLPLHNRTFYFGVQC